MLINRQRIQNSRRVRHAEIPLSSLTDMFNKHVGEYYDRVMMEKATHSFFGEIVGYRKVRVPKYLTIKLPTITKDYDYDSEYGDGSFRGYLISFNEKRLFQIGTRVEKHPIYKKTKSKITFHKEGK